MFNCLNRQEALRKEGKPVLNGITEISGEIMVQSLCDAAKERYESLKDKMAVYEENGLISIRGVLGDKDGLTADELEDTLTSGVIEPEM